MSLLLTTRWDLMMSNLYFVCSPPGMEERLPWEAAAKELWLAIRILCDHYSVCKDPKHKDQQC